MENVKVSNELLNEIIRYIEETQEAIDDEWGSCRKLKDLIECGEMPDIYEQLTKIRDGSNNEH